MGRVTESVEQGFDCRVLFLAFAMLATGCGTTLPDAYDRKPAANAITGITVPNASDGSADASRSSAPIAGQAVREDAAARRVAVWTFTFDYDDVDIRSADLDTVNEISDYIRHNSALRIGIDGSMSPRGIDPHNRGLRDRRVEVVRAALIAVGVPAYIIETVTLGREERINRDRSVEVLLRTTE